MSERMTEGLWVAGTAVVSSTAFIVLGIMFGGSPLRWDIHVIFESAILAAMLAPDSVGTSCTEGKACRRVLQ
jgi:hypothetical protein